MQQGFLKGEFEVPAEHSLSLSRGGAWRVAKVTFLGQTDSSPGRTFHYLLLTTHYLLLTSYY